MKHCESVLMNRIDLGEKKVKIKIKVLKASELLFFLAFMFYIMYQMLTSSLLVYEMPGVFFALLKYLTLGIIIIKWFVTERFTGFKLAVWSVILAVVFTVAVVSDYSNLILIIALVLSAQDIDFEKIVKFLFWNLLFWSVFVYFLYAVGYLPDLTFIHNLENGKQTIAHSYGFVYYAAIGYASMALTLMYLYMRKNTTLVENIILIIINYGLYKLHTTRLSWQMTVIFIIINFIISRTDILDLSKKIYGVIATIMPGALFIFTLKFVDMYAEGKVDFTKYGLRSIISRLEYSVQAFDIYGVKLFGSHVVQYGNTAKYYGNATSSFYIDSGYVYVLIAYGVFFSVILALIYTFLFRYIWKLRDKKLYLWLGMMLTASIINNFLLGLIYNPILFFIPKIIKEAEKTKE